MGDVRSDAAIRAKALSILEEIAALETRLEWLATSASMIREDFLSAALEVAATEIAAARIKASALIKRA